MRIRLLAILLATCCAPAFGQTPLWNGVLDPSRAVDWSQAGSAHINDARTQCVTTACNTLAGGSVTGPNITAALASAAYNQYVVVPAGTFSIAGFTFPQSGNLSTSCTANCSNITLRGAGSNATFLLFTGTIGGTGPCASFDVCMGPNASNANGSPPHGGFPPQNLGNVTGGVGKGSTVITIGSPLSSGSAPVVNAVGIMDQLDLVNDPEHPVTAVGNANGIYTGTFATCGSNACNGQTFVMGGFTNLSNNGSFTVSASSTTSITTNNSSSVTESTTKGIAATVSPWPGCELPSSPVSNSPACWSGAFPGGFSRGGNVLGAMRGQQQIFRFTAVSGTGPWNVTVTPAVYAPNWSTAQSPQMWWSSAPVYNDGIEYMSLDHTGSASSNSGVLIHNCHGCWYKGIRSIKQTAGTSNGVQTWSHVATSLSAHVTIRDSYFYGDTGEYTDSYSHGSYGASDILEENNIIQHPSPTNFSSADCEGCVAGYNFGVNYSFNNGGPSPVTNNTQWFQGGTAMHATNMLALVEGNINNGAFIDATHGAHVLNTFFRNRWPGIEQNGSCTNPTPCTNNPTIPSSNTVAARLNTGARYNNLIANVLGTSGYHTKYLSTAASTGSLYTSTIALGAYIEVSVLDPLVQPTTYIWGNYSLCSDVSNCGVQRFISSEVPSLLTSFPNPLPATHTIPASFYYASQPTWWPSGKPWPPVHPENTTGGNVGQCGTGGTGFNQYQQATSSGQCGGASFALTAGGLVTSNPAMDCYLNTMGGSVNGTENAALAFDASACYAAVTPTVATPTYLPVAGTFSLAQSVAISTTTGGAALVYCLDTNNTCTPSTAYTTPVSISATRYLRAQGSLSGFISSAISSGQYIIVPVAANPSCSPAGGNFSANTSVSCTESSAGAIMCGTTDGTAPSISGASCGGTSTLITGAFTVGSITLKVIAGGTGYSPSAIVSYIFSIFPGGPVLYAARTSTPGFKDCVHGFSSVNYDPTSETCLPGASTGTPGSALVFQSGASDPLPFGTIASGAIMNTSWKEPDFGSFGVFVTDQGPADGLHNPCSTITSDCELGSDGDHDAFGTGSFFNGGKDVMLTYVNGGSVPFLAHINEANVIAQSCSFTGAGRCVVPSNIISTNCIPGSTCANNRIGGGSITMSRSPNDASNTVYEVSFPKIYKSVIISSVDGSGNPTGTGDTITRTLYADFTSDSSGAIPCSILPSDVTATWFGGTGVSNGGAITIPFGGGGSYQTQATPVSTDTFIAPVNNNSQKSITTWSWAAGTVTLTVANALTVGHNIIVASLTGSGAGAAAVNGVFQTTAVTSTTVSYALVTDPGTCSGGGCTGTMGYAHAMFQVVSGTTPSGTEPVWNNLCQTVGDTCSDGAVTYVNIGNVGAQGQGFFVAHFDPQRGCRLINTRLAKVYNGTNEGAAWPAAGTPDTAGAEITDDAVTCYRMGGSNCGTTGTVAFTDHYLLHAAGQALTSQYGRFSPTPTGGSINTDYGPGNPLATVGNGSCTAGSVAWTQYRFWPNMLFQSGATYTHGTGSSTQYVVSPIDHNYYAFIGSTGAFTTDPSLDATNWTYKSGFCYNYTPDWYSNIIRPTLELGPKYGGSGHAVNGYAYDWRGGSLYSHFNNQPNCQTNGCSGPYVGSPNPGVIAVTNNYPSDYHPTDRAPGLLDLPPIPLISWNVPSYGGVGIPGVNGGGTGVGMYCCSGFAEHALTSTDGLKTLYRIAHTYCSGDNAMFSIQQCIGVLSQDAKMIAWGSDFMCTRGDTNTGATTALNCPFAQYQPTSGGCVQLNDPVFPLSNNTNASHYQITSTGSASAGSCSIGVTEGTLPAWSGCQTLSSTCTDNFGVVFTNIGPQSGRGDIAVICVICANQGLQLLQRANPTMFSQNQSGEAEKKRGVR